MMAIASEVTLPDVAILTRAVENVFRKLIRILVGKISLKKLQEMIQVIFVEEAEAMLRLEKPGKNVPMSTLAVVTGFDTRTLTKIRAKGSYLKPFHEEQRFLNEITPECSVLDFWESSSKYRNVKSGKPRVLPIRGAKISFESLIGDSNSTRGVTVSSFLHRLQASQSIVVDKENNKVHMIDKRYMPFGSADQTENAKIGMAAVGNLLETIAHNLTAAEKSGELFYQKGSWTHRVTIEERDKLRQMFRKFLLKTDDKARDMFKQYEHDEVNTDQVTAGIGMFYFEEESQD
jgi:hypothetical protein